MYLRGNWSQMFSNIIIISILFVLKVDQILNISNKSVTICVRKEEDLETRAHPQAGSIRTQNVL